MKNILVSLLLIAVLLSLLGCASEEASGHFTTHSGESNLSSGTQSGNTSSGIPPFSTVTTGALVPPVPTSTGTLPPEPTLPTVEPELDPKTQFIVSQVPVIDFLYCEQCVNQWVHFYTEVSDTPIIQKDPALAGKKTFYFEGEKLYITYEDTTYYPVGGYTFPRYVHEDFEDSIYVYPDGSIAEITNHTLFQLEIDRTTTEEELWQQLSPKLCDFVELDGYDAVEVMMFPYMDIEDTNPELYYSQFYAMVTIYSTYDGYYVNEIVLSVKMDGTVDNMWHYKIPVEPDAFQFTINPETEAAVLDIRLRAFPRSGVEYIGYEFFKNPIYRYYNEELYVEYAVKLKLSETEFETRLLVPVRILTMDLEELWRDAAIYET